MQLVSILRKDSDESKRASAALLLAHMKNGNELIKVLVPSMRDPSDQVRNNVMRVLGATLSKIKVADFPINESVVALHFPSTTDRNKALYIISSLVEEPHYAHYVIRHAGQELIDELKLSQPNIHELSYEILKKISHKNFSDRDYSSWEKWLKKVKKNETA